MLVDSSKFGRVSLARFATIDQVDILVTDSDAGPEVLEALRAMNVEVCTD